MNRMIARGWRWPLALPWKFATAVERRFGIVATLLAGVFFLLTGLFLIGGLITLIPGLMLAGLGIVLIARALI